ncbi:MAG TPA: SCO family protein [Acidobacteriota bacterium]|nr:SCO family protein [Acidobacteriota bacterium]
MSTNLALQTCIKSLTWLAVLLTAACAADQGGFNGTVVGPELENPRLSGTNWDGEPFRLEDLKGKVSLVSFGYTFCPDVCPFTLAKLKQLSRDLGEDKDSLAVVFVSVDPQRDTVDKLAQYVPGFDPSFYGIHLEQGSMRKMLETFGVIVQFGPPGDNGFYYVDHTPDIYLFDSGGKLRLRFPPNAKVDRMLADVRKLVQSEVMVSR